MVKPSGVLQYAFALAGAGGTVSFNCFVTDDANGNHFGGGGAIPSDCIVEAYSVPEVLGAGTSNAGRLITAIVKTIVNGILTGLTVTLTNNSPGGGDSINGRTVIRLNNRENMAL